MRPLLDEWFRDTGYSGERDQKERVLAPEISQARTMLHRPEGLGRKRNNMTFLEIAAPLAERGFRVFPLVPKNKMPVRMSWGDHFDAATTDVVALEQWDREVP